MLEGPDGAIRFPSGPATTTSMEVLIMTNPASTTETVRNAIVEMLHRKQQSRAARLVQEMTLPSEEESSAFERPGSAVLRDPVPDAPRQRRTLAAIAGMR